MNAQTSPVERTTLRASRQVVVMSIPVMGGNGKIQNRLLTFDRAPSKEFAVATAERLHRESCDKESYANEWARCVEVMKQVPEQLFAQMYQGRSMSITHLVSVQTKNETVSRIFSSRSCKPHTVDEFTAGNTR